MRQVSTSDMRKIILASASPRRKEILKKTGLAFEVDPTDYKEDMQNGMPPRKLARFLSSAKACAAAVKYRNAIIIAADTIIAYKGKIMGKPHTPAEALRMLRTLNGRSHLVITGFTVIDTATGKQISRSVSTQVYFKKLSVKELVAYVGTGEPLDKAGAYAIQELGAVMVKKIEGDFFNVVGLPLSALTDSLKQFGIEVTQGIR